MSEEHNFNVELEWLSAIREGDEAAFKLLFNRYYFSLTRFAWRYTKSEAIAEELVQDLFTEIWEQRQTWTVYGRLRPFLYRVMKEKSLNYLKHIKVKQTYDVRWMEHWVESIILPEEEDKEEQMQLFRQALIRAIEDLPPRCKMIYKLHKYDGLTYQEIAEVMDISKKTVESQMTRAIKLLRKRLTHGMPFMP